MIHCDCFAFDGDVCTATTYRRCDNCRFYKPKSQEDAILVRRHGTTDLNEICAKHTEQVLARYEQAEKRYKVAKAALWGVAKNDDEKM